MHRNEPTMFVRRVRKVLQIPGATIGVKVWHEIQTFDDIACGLPEAFQTLTRFRCGLVGKHVAQGGSFPRRISDYN
jgi:hypothetical protein